MKLLRIEFANLPIFEDDSFYVDFIATDRVMENENLFAVNRVLHTENLLSLVGINATGKTTVLRLLNAAARVVIENMGLNDLNLADIDIIRDGTVMRIFFYHEGSYYLLESIIGCNTIGANLQDGVWYYYKEEVLYKKSQAAVTNKKNVFDFSKSVKNISIKKRSELKEETQKALKDDDSMVILATRGNGCSVFDQLDANYLNSSPMLGKTPAEVLNVFDHNIDYLTAEKDKSSQKVHWKLKFKNRDKVYDINFIQGLNQLLSAGTIKGHAILGKTISVLHTGGYLFVDELENHFNKELVRMIMELFNSKATNPHGACLIFSTHYAEILDFINRKDNVYITRKKEGLLSISKYADEVKRNDIKKSDIIISNFLKGTAPQYESIKALREAICKAI